MKKCGFKKNDDWYGINEEMANIVDYELIEAIETIEDKIDSQNGNQNDNKIVKNKTCNNTKILLKYQCETCTKIFKQKSQLNYHKNRKNKCEVINEKSSNNNINIQNNINDKPINPIAEILPELAQNNQITQNKIPLQIEILTNDLQCKHCKKCFTRKDIVTSHIKKSCPVIKNQNKEKQVIVEKLLLLETKYKKLEEEIKNKNDIIKDKDEIIKSKDIIIKNMKKNIKK